MFGNDSPFGSLTSGGQKCSVGMRWFRIRKAAFLPGFYRKQFEELGSETVRAYVTQPPGFVIDTHTSITPTVGQIRPQMQDWLREQYDRAERRKTWLITMEVAITIFVAAELFSSTICSRVCALHNTVKTTQMRSARTGLASRCPSRGRI